MSTTGNQGRAGAPSSGRGRLPAVRRNRRPALAALALLLVLGGSLASALIAYRSGDRVDVLVARETITFGQEVTSGDFTVARVSADSTNVVDAADVDRFVGTTATGRIPAGTLVNSQMFQTEDVTPKGAELVGIVLDSAKRPTEPPEPGDVVSLYYVSQSGGKSVGNYSPGDPVVEAALVMESGASASADGLSLTVLVEEDDAGVVAEFAAGGSLAVTVLPDNTEPSVAPATSGSE